MPKIKKPRKDGAERRPDGILTVPQADGSHKAHHGTKCDGSHKYRFVIDAGRDPLTNRRRQRTYTFAKLKDAKAERARLSNDVNKGQFVDRWNGTVSELCDAYLKWACYGKEANTEASYRLALLPVRERLGTRRAQSITRDDIEELRDWMLSAGRKRGGRPGSGLGPRSVRLTLGRLSAAFTLAIRDRRLSVNPCTYVGLPSQERAERVTWTEADARLFLKTADEDRLAAGWRMTLYGARRGEVLGLRWEEDVDLDAGTITIGRSRVVVGSQVIVKAPKSDRGFRTLPLDDVLVGALRELHKRQSAERLEAGEAYEASGYVIVDELGAPVHPEWFSDEFGRVSEAAGVPKIRLHDGRHTANSLLAAAGIPPHIRAGWCGHGEAVNVAVYTHVQPGDLAQARDALSRIYGAV